jgi:hypothetical protein
MSLLLLFSGEAEIAIKHRSENAIYIKFRDKRLCIEFRDKRVNVKFREKRVVS